MLTNCYDIKPGYRIVFKYQFYDNCFKEIDVLLHLVLMLCLICVNTGVRVVRIVSVNLFSFYPFLYSFKGPFNTYPFYFTFIKAVAINKELSEPLRAKRVGISETRHDPTKPYCLKTSVYVNVPFILKVGWKESKQCRPTGDRW